MTREVQYPRCGRKGTLQIHPRRRAEHRRRRAARPVASHRQPADPASRRDLVRARRDHAAALRPERASPRPRRRGRDVPPRHRVLAHRNRRALTARCDPEQAPSRQANRVIAWRINAYGKAADRGNARADLPRLLRIRTEMIDPTATGTVKPPSADLRRPRGREALSAHPPAPVDDTTTGSLEQRADYAELRIGRRTHRCPRPFPLKDIVNLLRAARSCPVKSTLPIVFSRRTSPHPIQRTRGCEAGSGEPTAGGVD